MPQDPSLVPPPVSASASALAASQTATAKAPAAEPAPNAPSAKTDMKSRIATFAKESIEDPNAVPTQISRQAIHPGDTDINNPNPTGEPKAPAAAPAPGAEPPNYKVLKDALAAKDAKLAELQTELDKLKPDAELVTTLRAELTTKQKDYDEVQEFRQKTGLLNSEVFYNNITKPREDISTYIKKELKADGIDEGVWEQAQSAKNRVELETVVKENITSDLLKNEFYRVFFIDQDLRVKENAALEAPAKYLNDFKAQETARQNQIRENNTRNFDGTIALAMQDAAAMVSKTGEHRLVELLELPDNPEHNEKVVKPIVKAADDYAMALLKERLDAGLPVTRENAASIVYLCRNALAAQAASRDRMKWYNLAQDLETEVINLREKLEIKTARNHPTPGGNAAAPTPKTNGVIPGDTLKERISNAAKMSVEGTL